MDRTRWIIFAVTCVAVIAGLVLFSNKDKVDVSSVDPVKITTSGEMPDRVIGDPASKVVVIEYADYQCPGCSAAFPQIKAVSEEYKSQVAFVFRNYPLTSGHQHAFAMAAAAEAAGLQGKFWQMHDLIYQTRSEWVDLQAEQRNERIEGFAQQLSLNIDQFKTDLTSKKVADKINGDRALGVKMNVDATPTFFINGKKVSGEIVSDLMTSKGNLLRDSLDDAIKSAGGTPPARATSSN